MALLSNYHALGKNVKNTHTPPQLDPQTVKAHSSTHLYRE